MKMKNNKSPYVVVGTPSKIFALRLNEEVFVAHLWIKDSTGEWVAMTLNGDAMRLTKDDVYPASIGHDEKTVQDSVFIKSWQHAGEKIWLVMAGKRTPVWVNARLLQAGIRVLQDRDEVRIHQKRSVFFSTEELARVVPFPAGTSPVFCPRCKQPLVVGTPSVQCPRCFLWHHHQQHQQDEAHALEGLEDEASSLGCWEYSARCAMCDQLTDLHSGFRWSPSEL